MSRGGQSVSHSSANRITRRPQAEAANKAAAFSQYREEIKQNPSAFLKYVRATPARENGDNGNIYWKNSLARDVHA